MASRSIEAGRAFMRLYIDDNEFRRGLTSASRRLKSFGSTVAGIGARFTAFGLGLAAPLTAAVKAASDAQETFGKFDVVFGSSAAAAKKWGDELASQVGRSKTEVAGFLSGFQDLLVPIGIDPELAEESSKQLTKLAIDLASFNNKSDGDAVNDLQAALTGSSEVMKKYGVIVNEAAVKQELLNQGIDPKGASEQQKVFARLNIIMAGTTAAQGDAIRTAGGFANQMKALQGRIQDAAVSLGQALLPTVTAVVTRLVSVVEAVGRWAEANGDTVRTVGLLAVAATSLGVSLVTLGGTIAATGVAVGGLARAFGALRIAMNLVARSPYVAGLVVAGAAIATIANNAFTATRRLEALKRSVDELGESQTFGDSKEVSLMADRFEQLARKSRLSKEEFREFGRLRSELGVEFGIGASEIDKQTRSVTNAEKLIAQVRAGQGRQSVNSIRQQITTNDLLIERLEQTKATEKEIEAARARSIELQKRLSDTQAFISDVSVPDPPKIDLGQVGDDAEKAGKETGESFASALFGTIESSISQVVGEVAASVTEGVEQIGGGLARFDAVADQFKDDQRRVAASLREARSSLRLGAFGGAGLNQRSDPQLVSVGEATLEKMAELVGLGKEQLDAIKNSGLVGV